MAYSYRAVTRKKICISFDWHNDARYRNLLAAWIANQNNPVDFEDLTPGAIDTNDVSRVKAVLTSRIRTATHTLVIVGAHANTPHADRVKIGDTNWIWWEINQTKLQGKKLIAVKLSKSYVSPNPLLGAGGTTWALEFSQEAVLNAIARA